MKNLLLLLATVLFLGLLPEASGQVRLGLKAGLNLANLNYDDDFDIETKILPTFMVGGVAEFDFSENLSLGTGLQYHGRGAQDADVDDYKVTMGYIQVPVQIQYRSSGFFAAAGPYVAFAISGQTKDGDESEDIDFGSSVEDDFSALDYGLNLEAGYEFGQLRATASYTFGLADGVPGDLQDFVDGGVKHGVIGVALTYLFGGE